MGALMSFYTGTLEQFTSWEVSACKAEGIPNKHSQKYSEAIEPPNTSGDYIWKFGKYDTLELPKITYQEALDQGYFETPEE